MISLFVITDLPLSPFAQSHVLVRQHPDATLHSFNHLVGAGELSLPLGPARNEFGPAVVRVRTAKSAVAGDHFLHAHFVGWQTAIVRKEIALTSARAPRHLSGLADAKVEQHCHRYGHYDEHQSHGSPLPRADPWL